MYIVSFQTIIYFLSSHLNVYLSHGVVLISMFIHFLFQTVIKIER